MRNLIITSGYAYKSRQLKPFLLSSYQYAPDAEVILFSDNGTPEYLSKITSYNPNTQIIVPAETKWRKNMWRSNGKLRFIIKSKKIRPILKHILDPYKPGSFGKMSTAFFHILLARFFWVDFFLKEYRSDIDNIMLTDSRDVLFQGDPFSGFQESLLFGEEPIKISKCPFNSSWIRHVYTDKWVNRLGNMPVLCSGVIIGKQDQLRLFIKYMVSEIIKNMGKTINTTGTDQGINNKIIHGDKVLPFTTSRNGDELLTTLHYSDLSEFIFDDLKGLKTKDGRPVKIVHQYDRHKILSDWVEKKYS